MTTEAIPDERAVERAAVADALRSMGTHRQPCVVCWTAPAEGHYPRRFDLPEVVWLCVECHRLIHQDPPDPAVPTAMRRERESLGLSLRELSVRAGIEPGRLSMLERGMPATDRERDQVRDTFTTIRSALNR